MQRTILILGQGTNTAWDAQAQTASYYGLVQGPFFQDAGYTNKAGNAYGGYAECAFACVLNRIYHCVGQYRATGPTLTTSVNIGGLIAASSPARSGAGNLAAVSPPQDQANPSHYYDATDLDAITAGQKIGLMQTLTACTSAPVNPSLGVTCDSVGQGFCSPFIFPYNGASTGMVYLNGPYYSHLGGNSGPYGAGFNSDMSITQDYCPGAFVASYLQWQNTSDGSGDTYGQTTATFGAGATAGSLTTSTLSATVQGVGFVGLMHDTTDISAVPAARYCGLAWTGSVVSGNIRIGNAGVHIRPAGNNATLLVSGCTYPSGLDWSGTSSNGATPTITYTTFGAPRGDNLFEENMTAIPTAGVFSNLAFRSGAQTYGGTPSTVTIQNGPNSGDTGASGIISTTGAANFTNTSLSVTSHAASTWSFDLTDIAAFTPMNGLLLSVSNTTGGSTRSVTMQAYSANFTTPAHRGLLMQGAG